MNIFIGGPMAQHQQRFAQDYPDVQFVFASYEDTLRKWVRGATRADHVVIDQSRCSHKIIDALRKRGCRPVMVDGKAEIRKVLDDLLAHGSTQHRYAGAGSEYAGWFAWM